MPKKATIPFGLEGRFPLINDERMAERLGTTVDVIRWLVDTRQIGAVMIGERYRFRPDVVEDAVSRRSELLDTVALLTVKNPKIAAFDRRSLFPDEIADFFGVPVSEVRGVLTRGRRSDSVSKRDLWRLLVAGAELRGKQLSDFEARLTVVRRQRTIIPKLTRQLMKQRDCGRCRYCGRAVSDDATTDHVIPKSRGGSDEIDNLVISCTPCNNRKGRKLPHEAGMRVLPAGTTRRRSKAHVVPLLPPDVPYSTLVMGGFPDNATPN